MSFVKNLSFVIPDNEQYTGNKKTEQKLFDFLTLNYKFEVLREQTFEWCKNVHKLRFDFVIDELNLIIELDGPQHFKQVSNWQSPEETQASDAKKMEDANKHGYSVLRLDQEDVWNNTHNWDIKIFEMIVGCQSSRNVFGGSWQPTVCNTGKIKYDNSDAKNTIVIRNGTDEKEEYEISIYESFTSEKFFDSIKSKVISKIIRDSKTLKYYIKLNDWEPFDENYATKIFFDIVSNCMKESLIKLTDDKNKKLLEKRINTWWNKKYTNPTLVMEILFKYLDIDIIDVLDKHKKIKEKYHNDTKLINQFLEEYIDVTYDKNNVMLFSVIYSLFLDWIKKNNKDIVKPNRFQSIFGNKFKYEDLKGDTIYFGICLKFIEQILD